MLSHSRALDLPPNSLEGARSVNGHSTLPGWNPMTTTTRESRRAPKYPFLRLRILARPADPTADEGLPGLRALPPASKASALPRSPLLRRVLGKALVDLFCPHGEPRCQPCSASGKQAPLDHCTLAATCPYGVLFAASSSQRPPFALYLLPHQGASLRLEVTLYGEAWRLYPWALAGLQRAFQVGLGKTRQPWSIESISRVQPGRRRLHLGGTDLGRLPATLEPDDLGDLMDLDLAPRPIEVRFLSPTRLMRDGKLLPRQAPLPFELLVGRALDRLRGVFGEAAIEDISGPSREAIELEAARVQLLSDRTRWVEVKDYSSRSGRELYLGGRVGRLTYSDEAARFFPLLRAAEVLHLGKNVASGCGRVRVDLAPASHVNPI